MDSTYPDATNIEAGAHSVWPRAGPAAVAGAAAGAAWLRTGGPDHCQQGRTQLSGEGRPDITNLLQVCIERCTRRSGCAAYCAASGRRGRHRKVDHSDTGITEVRSGRAAQSRCDALVQSLNSS